MGLRSDLVKANETKAKKRFGQHFLRDSGTLSRIVRLIQPEENDLILEIGAGDGALSTRLAERAACHIALEIDRDCIPSLRKSLAPFDNAEIIHADILATDTEDLIARYLKPDQRLKVVGNLPYNIATAIIEKLFQSRIRADEMHFMIQLEVAQRITATPDTREYGYFSVYCQHHSDVRMAFKVSSACFVPRPKVSSAMISMRPKTSQRNEEAESVFVSLCKAAFAYRRKTIENSLGRHPVFAGFTQPLLERASIEGSRRAESLTVREYEVMAQIALNEFLLGS
jgi:16S rRNA (adenine1518-N6/adenine1519-N6)-dimethyltransferase